VRRVVERATNAMHSASGGSSPFWAGAEDIRDILTLTGIRMAPMEQVPPEPERAALAARALGYPVVMKAVASGVLHKSEVGGVVLGLADDAAVRGAAQAMAARFRDAGHPLEALLLQKQIQGGVEALVGVTLDPSLGPLLVAGLGGVQVELLRDVSFRITPVSDVDAAEMIAGLRAARLLDGYRGAPAVDRAALLDVIQRLSALVEAFPELVELELNPLVVLPRGQGAVAVDVRVRIAPAA
jgi:acyl-CoA synthetase (NDP forming)